MNIRNVISFFGLFAMTLSFVSCVRNYDNDQCQAAQLNLGTVQREIAIGMSQADVARVLGSPNIVTHDKDKKETWIYDKIASEVKKSGAANCFILYSSASEYKSVSQRTMTVVIKFREDQTIEDVTYHSSKF